MNTLLEHPIALVIGSLIVSLLITAGASYMECHGKWDDSGKPVKWALFAGCRLQMSDGYWMPAANYREIP